MAVFDPPFVQKLDTSFEDDLRKAREITLHEVERWSRAERLRNHLIRMFREQL